jgi:hypothetical protein
MTIDSGASFDLARTSPPIIDRRSSPQPSRTPRAAWRIIPEIDKDARFVAYAQLIPGRIALFVILIVLTALLYLLGVDIAVAPLAAVYAYAQQQHRRYLLPLATLLLLYKNHFWVDSSLVSHVVEQEGLAGLVNQNLLFAGTLALVVVLCSGLLVLWPRIVAITFFRRSTLCLIAGFIALVALAQSPIAAGAPRVLLWSFLMTFLPFLWFLAYALAGAGAREQAPFWEHLGVFHPFWGATLTPFGKGLSYLRKFEAKTPEDLAVTQLKGLKLAAWTLLLAACLNGFTALVHGRLALPRFDDAFSGYLAGTPYPRYLCWASLVAYFVEDVLNMTVWGGAIIVCARMAGFRLLRNTYRPMESTTLAEFWNRYYFYYKELLVDHFFYPVFLRYFRTNRKLRMFFATFMAACVGNLTYHFLRDIHFVAELGWRNALSGEASHAFYTFLLAIGVGVSQMRVRSDRPRKGWLRGRVLPCLWVALFFCVLHVFDAPLDRVHTIGQRSDFLSYLLGIDAWI